MQAQGTSLTDRIAIEQERNGWADLSRDDTIRAIRSALKRRSGKSWSVTGGRGTAYGWITIDAPPARRTAKHVQVGEDEYGHAVYELRDTGERQEFGYMTPADLRELMTLMGKDPDSQADYQGISIPASTDYRVEMIARAEGRNPSAYGRPYWD